MSNRSSELRNLGRRLAGVTMPIERKRMKWKRNWPCLCGSDKKYKNCCLGEIDALTLSDGDATIRALPEDIKKMIDAHRETEEKKGSLYNE